MILRREIGTVWVIVLLGLVVGFALVVGAVEGNGVAVLSTSGVGEEGRAWWREMVDIGSALLVLVIGFVTVYIMFKQKKLGERQTRLMAWEKRYEVYQATVRFVRGVVSVNGVTQEMLREWEWGVRDRELLFEDDVMELVGKMDKKSKRLKDWKKAIEEAEGNDRKTEVAKEMNGLVKWFDGVEGKVRVVFGRYLKVREQ